jgi:hypothetical protein
VGLIEAVGLNSFFKDNAKLAQHILPVVGRSFPFDFQVLDRQVDQFLQGQI